MPQSFALITPSYAPDFERCALLVESVQRHVRPLPAHYLIVDRRDVAQFSVLAGASTHIVEAESLLPSWLRRAPGTRRLWFGRHCKPVRNWILQQIIKIAAAARVGADVVLFADSDVTFIRSFELSRLVRGNRVRLFAFPAEDWPEPEQRWRQTAATVLGIPAAQLPAKRFVGNLISWRTDQVLRLQARIEQVAGCGWVEALLRHWHLSEYVLYGCFVSAADTRETVHFPEHAPWVREWWEPRRPSAAELQAFFAGVQPENVAVMISAKARLPVSTYLRYVRR